MSIPLIAALVVYVALAAGGYVVTGILKGLWINAFRKGLPEIMAGFWDVYPGRKWPGPLKLIGYPMTIVFLAMVAIAWVLVFVLMLIALSPIAAWRIVTHRRRRGRPGPHRPPPAVEARMRATG